MKMFSNKDIIIVNKTKEVLFNIIFDFLFLILAVNQIILSFTNDPKSNILILAFALTRGKTLTKIIKLIKNKT
jgi:hypothetical protein